MNAPVPFTYNPGTWDILWDGFWLDRADAAEFSFQNSPSQASSTASLLIMVAVGVSWLNCDLVFSCGGAGRE